MKIAYMTSPSRQLQAPSVSACDHRAPPPIRISKDGRQPADQSPARSGDRFRRHASPASAATRAGDAGLAWRSCSGVRLPRALTVGFIDQALKASKGIAGLRSHAGFECCAHRCDDGGRRDQRGYKTYDKGLAACRRLMSIPGVEQLTALAFVAAIDDPSRIRGSRDVGAYLGLVPRRYQSGELDYTGGISKCGDGRVRTLLYEAANVMLTRYKGQLKLKGCGSKNRITVETTGNSTV